MAKIFLSEEEKRFRKLENRMDRFDAIVVEYLRKSKGTVADLCGRIGCTQSSLWRYRNCPQSFAKAPFDVVCGVLRLANASNIDIRTVCGLPTGLPEDRSHEEN